MENLLISSPLQGFTDYIFRNACHKYFGGIDCFYAPYIRLRGDMKIKPAQQRNIEPVNNQSINLVPQIMTKSSDKFIFIADYCKTLGYREVNWNLGCPYPMVAKRGLGSGQIRNIDNIQEILDNVFNKISIQISIKTRLGYENKEEIFPLLELLENYPVKNVSIHPRIGKQLYKGDVDLDAFEECLESTKHKVIYNGDITSVEKFRHLQKKFPSIDTWMIGRGLIANPFLPQMIKNNMPQLPENKTDIFRKFHDELFYNYSMQLSGDKHLLLKMYQFWTYFIFVFPEHTKALKRIKKAKNIDAYHQVISSIFLH